MSNRQGIESIKTSSSAHIHSIPKRHRSKFLDLFMLEKKKEKLDQEYKMLNHKLEKTLCKLKEIEEQIDERNQNELSKKEKSTAKTQPVSSRSSGEKARWQTLKLGY